MPYNFGGNRIRRRRNRPRIFRFGEGGRIGGRLFPRSRFSSSWFNFNVNNPRVIEYDSSEEKEEEVESSGQTDSVLRVSNCNYNILQNTDAHRTDEYDITEANTGRDGPIPQLVVRRGQPFDIKLGFTRPYDRKKDDLKLVFEFGDDPSPIKGTYVDIILSDKDDPLEWGAKIKDQSGKTLTVTIMTPPTLYVGKWDFKVEVLEKSETDTCVHRYNHSQPIYILFNPWCKDDAVYMPEQNLLDEYILNQTGKIYVGNQRRLCGRRWNFGQDKNIKIQLLEEVLNKHSTVPHIKYGIKFESNILNCALYLLGEHEDVPMKDEFRGDPVKVTRKLSALVNCQDDDGVLTGNWSGDYSGGKSPTKWTGSVAILEQFYSTKQPVCYGQCWVFSGVLTTICRTLGIPARSVTNFASAHDTDESITIDKIYDGEGDEIDSSDSIW
ncbi:hypothetical protein KUTeg_019743 [Tegillarca granosa]|uniref:Transglutaminase-like domain-containing protein n=1 Tax=Tegillarca granosa TaxID=220873 RepID=A0ABQ9EHF7_TEGGR|nr:hypothetical protein KUTeg_019743 [Tegillarca granosa]